MLYPIKPVKGIGPNNVWAHRVVQEFVRLNGGTLRQDLIDRYITLPTERDADLVAHFMEGDVLRVEAIGWNSQILYYTEFNRPTWQRLCLFLNSRHHKGEL